MMSIKLIGKDPSRHPHTAPVFETYCPKCGETLLIKVDVVGTSFTLNMGVKRRKEFTQKSISTSTQFKPRVIT